MPQQKLRYRLGLQNDETRQTFFKTDDIAVSFPSEVKEAAGYRRLRRVAGTCVFALSLLVILNTNKSEFFSAPWPLLLKSSTSRRTGASLVSLHQTTEQVCRRPRSHDELRACFPQVLAKHDFAQNNDPICTNITNWKQLQHCTSHSTSTTTTTSDPARQTLQSPSLKVVHIIGERHSGTKFITGVLQKCFPKSTTTSVKVHRDLLRSKHFFQPLEDADSYLDANHVIVVVVREVLPWMAAMVEKPYHAPHHTKSMNDTAIVPLPWQQFVERPWSVRPGTILQDDENATIRCQEGFQQDEVIPCRPLENATIAQQPPWNIPPTRFRGFEPVYELDVRTGQPYRNLLDLRADKIANFALHVPFLLATTPSNVVIVRYEDVLREGTSRPLLEQVSARLGIAPSCRLFPGPQPERLQRRRFVDPAFRRWIAQHVHVEMEELLGYDMGWVKEELR